MNQDNKLESIKKMMASKQINMTSKRQIILDVFLKYDKHLKAEDVYDIVKGRGIGIATVYRALDVFEKADVLKVINIDRERYYELKAFSKKRVHINFKCQICGKINDCDDQVLRHKIIELINETEENQDATVNDVTIIMNGICSECKNK